MQHLSSPAGQMLRSDGGSGRCGPACRAIPWTSRVDQLREAEATHGARTSYPPTPYPPRSEDTRLYRDAWDLGWRHYGALRAQVLDYEAGLTGPRRQGYRDGVIARWAAEQRAREADRRAKLAALDAERTFLRAEAESEGAW